MVRGIARLFLLCIFVFWLIVAPWIDVLFVAVLLVLWAKSKRKEEKA